MKLSYNWLHELVHAAPQPGETASILTFAGIETSVVSAAVPVWKNVITAQILEVARHPQADKLSLCRVTDGTREYSIVCGASNVGNGKKVALAVIGAELPGGFQIKKAKIRGVESEGMMCSEEELGLAKESSGILILPEGTPLGKPLNEVLGDSDTVLEIEITTNRPDCLSVRGIARELSAKLGTPARFEDYMLKPVPGSVPVTVQAPDLCPRYIAHRISGVNVKPSPEWLARRLEKSGLRPINNIVDITNYVLLELGHPLHAFDEALMAGGKIVVRRAAAGESIRALDGKTYELNDSMLVIADERRPQAIAGIMGGEDSGVRESTRDIILESAIFEPMSIRKTSRALNLSSDASYRFERGTGWQTGEQAAARALQLITELAGGTVTGMIDVAARTYEPVVIDLRPARVEHVLNLKFTVNQILEILESLGFKAEKRGDTVSVTVPSWRLDVSGEIDLIEELARIYGYEHIPVTIMPVTPKSSQEVLRPAFENIIRSKLSALGFSEAVNYSFAEKHELEKLYLVPERFIANPLSRENEVLRPSLLPGLWKNLLLNRGQGYESVRLFETGTVFPGKREEKHFAMIASGPVWGSSWWRWDGKDVPASYDFYYLDGLVRAVLAEPGYSIGPDKNPLPFLHPGKSAAITYRGMVAGRLGMIRPELTEIAGSAEIAWFELNLGAIEQRRSVSVPRYAPVRRFPTVSRDISLVAPRDVPFSAVDKIIDDVCGKEKILESVQLFSVFDDPRKLGEGKISYSLRFTFRHGERTLTDADVNTIIEAFLGRLSREHGITLRG